TSIPISFPTRRSSDLLTPKWDERMPEENTPPVENQNNQPANNGQGQESAAPTTLEEALALLEAERNNASKWKTLSRQNEKKWERSEEHTSELQSRENL